MPNLKDFTIKFWVIYCVFVSISTEILSKFNLVNRQVLFWIYTVGIFFLLIVFRKKILSVRLKVGMPKYWRWYLLLVVLIWLPLMLIALYYPPNNYDSMTYHLSRIEHWIQDGNVEFYPTNNERQLFMPPMSEYVMLHWRLLGGGDMLLNLLQYLSMILSAILASLIVREWKGKRLTELLAVVLVSTIPMGIVQATSTQADYVVSFFVLATVYFFFKKNYGYLALCIGLGIFTKSTYVIFLLFFGVYSFFVLLKLKGLRVLKTLVLILLAVLVINAAQWQRNYQYFGSILGSKVSSKDTINQSFRPKYIVSNLVRNFGSQIGLPDRPYNYLIDDIITTIHRGLRIKTNDSTNTWFSENYFTQFSTQEDYAGNFILAFLIVFAGFSLFTKKSKVGVIYWSVIGGWVLFSFIFKWQPWDSRLVLPFFVFSCPVVAFIFIERENEFWKIRLLMIFLLLSAIPFVVGGRSIKFIRNNSYALSTRPLIADVFLRKTPRFDRFLNNGLTCYSSYEVIDQIEKLKVKNVGLYLGKNYEEYPLWVVLRHKKLDLKMVGMVKNKDNFNRNFKNVEKPEVVIFDSKHLYGVIEPRSIVKSYGFFGLDLAVLSEE